MWSGLIASALAKLASARVALHPVQDQTMIGVCARRAGVQSQRRRYMLEGFRVPALLRSQYSEQMPGIEMARCLLHYLQIQRLGRGCLPAAVSPRGAVQQLADGKLLFAQRLGHLFAEDIQATGCDKLSRQGGDIFSYVTQHILSYTI